MYQPSSGAGSTDSTNPEIEIISFHQRLNQSKHQAQNTQPGVYQPAMPLAAVFTGQAADQHCGKRMHPIFKQEPG